MLSDLEIHREIAAGSLKISPLDLHRLQPASLDVTLDNQFVVFRSHRADCIDPKVDSAHLTDRKQVAPGEHFVLHPGEFVLASTYERITLPDDLAARVDGKSSLGRLGLLVHSTAGFVDPGFEGQITLELANVNQLPIRLYPGMPICQLAFDRLGEPAGAPYRGKYQHQRGPRASRYHRNWDGESW